MGGIGPWIAAHRKLLVSVAGAAITVAIQAGWTANPYVSAVILIATAAGVYRAPNTGGPAPAKAKVKVPAAPHQSATPFRRDGKL